MIKFHFFNPPTKYGHMVSYSYKKLMGFISEMNGIIIVDSHEDADYTLCMFNHWSENYTKIPELETDSKKIMHLFDCRTSYSGKILSKALKNSDAIWCGGENLNGFKRFSAVPFFLPVGTWKEEKEEKNGTDISITMTNDYDPDSKYRPNFLKKALNLYPENTFEMHSKKFEYWGITFPENTIYNKTMGIESFRKFRYNLESTSKPQFKIGLENKHWSDRQALATSNFCQVITNYKPTLENWDSAIEIGEKIEYDIKALQSDIEKWKWSKLIKPLLKETSSAI